jgi:hypothetical protein
VSLLQKAKLYLVTHLHLAKDALHIYVALALLFGSAALLRWPLRSGRPWLLVLLAALLGEAWDLRDSIAYGTRVDLAANWKDLWNTMFWPTVITALARWTNLLKR